jgi:ABC-type sugar transport systems, ATPase components
VSKTFPNGVKAVSDFSLEIADGEFVVLVGPSGCGKSTILRTIAGLEDLDEGEIWIDEREISGIAPGKRDIAMVFQNYALYPHMSVYKNLAYSLTVGRVKREEIDRRVRETAKLLGIDELLDRRPGQLSGGQSQRVALGRAIVREPKVFLMDEPLSNLDAQLRQAMRTMMTRLHLQLKSTFLYVTHDQVEAMTMGDRIVIMKEGEIQQADTPEAVYQNPRNRFVAEFIGAPQINILPAALCRRERAVFANIDTNAIQIPDSVAEQLSGAAWETPTVDIGIRPEDITVRPAHTSGGVPAAVELRQSAGSEVYLHLRFLSGGHPVVAKVSPDHAAGRGDEVMVEINVRKLHFFDPVSGTSFSYNAYVNLLKTL